MRPASIGLSLLAACLTLASLGSGVRADPGCVPVGAWVAPGGARTDEVPAALAKRAVVLLGESHDDAEHHRWQLHTIAAMYSRRPDMVLGFEMFPRRVQPVLDRWSKGELGEAAFLRELDWPEIWGHDAELYLPLFHFARMHRLPMLALNVDRATARRVAAAGVAAVPPAEREGVGEPGPASAEYRGQSTCPMCTCMASAISRPASTAARTSPAEPVTLMIAPPAWRTSRTGQRPPAQRSNSSTICP